MDIVYDTPVDQLPKLLGQMNEDQRIAAKARMESHRAVRLEQTATHWHERQMPSKMKQPAAVRIKEWRGEPTCGGVEFFGELIPGWRMLRPGEVVVVDMADPLFRKIMAGGNIELTSESPTRPIVFASPMQATVTDPVRKAKNIPPAKVERVLEDVDEAMQKIRTEYRIRLGDEPDPELATAVQQRDLGEATKQEAEAEAEADGSVPRRRKGVIKDN